MFAFNAIIESVVTFEAFKSKAAFISAVLAFSAKAAVTSVTFAFKFKAVCVAVETGFAASDVLFTRSKPRFVRASAAVVAPVPPPEIANVPPNLPAVSANNV